MFSLHLIISDMSGYITLESDKIVNVDYHVMGDCLRGEKAKIVILFAHLSFLSEMQNMIFNGAKNIILNMYTCVLYG